MRNRIVSKGVPAAHISIVRDGVDLPPQNSAEPAFDQDVIRAIRGNFRFVLLHAGNLGFYGAWDTLLAGAREFSIDGIGLVFVGEGAQRDRLVSAAKDSPSVRFLPFFPGDKISSVLAAADAHVITVKRGLEGVVVPSKMYGILAAGKPIVVVAPRECDVVSIGESKGFSLAVDPDDPVSFANSVRRLARDQQALARMSAAASAAAPAFERGSELNKLILILEEAAQH
jgi:glycosyltransferase involved in cell wall biosynthesis